MTRPPLFFACNKCGYAGTEQRHPGCDYIAMPSAWQVYAMSLEADNARLRGEIEDEKSARRVVQQIADQFRADNARLRSSHAAEIAAAREAVREARREGYEAAASIIERRGGCVGWKDLAAHLRAQIAPADAGGTSHG